MAAHMQLAAATLNQQLATLTPVQLAAYHAVQQVLQNPNHPLQLITPNGYIPLVRRTPRPPRQTQQNRPARRYRHRVSTAAEKGTAKRSLNAWLGFRSYYLRIFQHMPQKEVSTYLTIMWQHDPFKATWAIVAKTYSIVRDKLGKDNIPLYDFLSIVCPAIGLVDIYQYLTIFKFEFVTDSMGVTTFQQTSLPDLSTLQINTMGETEILQLCIKAKLIPKESQTFKYLDSGLTVFPYALTPEQLFLQRIRNDPKGVAAHIFGFNVEHPFLEISTSEAPQEMVLPITNDIETSQTEEATSTSTLVEYQQPVPEYAWSGNMSDLYRPNEMAVNLDPLDEHSWMTTDINNPISFDAFLAATGFDQSSLDPDLPEDQNLDYSFWDSF